MRLNSRGIKTSETNVAPARCTGTPGVGQERYAPLLRSICQITLFIMNLDFSPKLSAIITQRTARALLKRAVYPCTLSVDTSGHWGQAIKRVAQAETDILGL